MTKPGRNLVVANSSESDLASNLVIDVSSNSACFCKDSVFVHDAIHAFQRFPRYESWFICSQPMRCATSKQPSHGPKGHGRLGCPKRQGPMAPSGAPWNPMGQGLSFLGFPEGCCRTSNRAWKNKFTSPAWAFWAYSAPHGAHS